MGRQQSYVKFKNKEVLISELKKYQYRDSSMYQTYVLGVGKVIKEVEPFMKDELVLVIGGERYGQRNVQRLQEETKIDNAEEIVFVDNEVYWELGDGDLGKFLDEHFYYLSFEEIEKLVEN